MTMHTIEFTVAQDGRIAPNIPQAAGHCGDDRAAVIRFCVPFAEDCRYRIEIVDGTGAYDITDLLDATDGVVSYAIPAAWTAAGTAAVRLVVTDAAAKTRAHTHAGYIYFEDRENGHQVAANARPAWQMLLEDAQSFLKDVEGKLRRGELNGKDGKDGEQGEKGEKGDPGEVSLAYARDTFAAALTAEKSGATVCADDVDGTEHTVQADIPLTVIADTHTARIVDGTALPLYGKTRMPLIAGKTYTVTVNEESYTYTAQSQADGEAVSLGSIPFLGDESEPVGIWCEVQSGNYEWYLNTSQPADTGTFTVGVTLADDVTVSCCGKNLFRLQDFSETTGTSQLRCENGVLRITYTTTVSTSTPLSVSRLREHYVGASFLPAGKYTFSCVALKQRFPYLEIKLDNGTTLPLKAGVTTAVPRPFSPYAIKFEEGVQMLAGEEYVTTLQLECGAQTAYEPYRGEQRQTGREAMTFRSVSPCMTVLADMPVTVRYHRDLAAVIARLEARAGG